jgi:hypothetical protein
VKLTSPPPKNNLEGRPGRHPGNERAKESKHLALSGNALKHPKAARQKPSGTSRPTTPQNKQKRHGANRPVLPGILKTTELPLNIDQSAFDEDSRDQKSLRISPGFKTALRTSRNLWPDLQHLAWHREYKFCA